MPYASIYRDELFRDRVALVTGGGSGIGRCIAHELASLGATLILAGRDPAKLDGVAGEIAEDGGAAEAIPCDIRDEAQVAALFAEAARRRGPVELLVNNGGGQFAAPVASLSPRGWRAVVETNLTGTFLMCKQAFESGMSERGGAIVNVVADMWRGMPMMAHSGAARAGVVNLTQTLALEWAPSNVRVNAVAPGIIASSGLGNYPEPVQAILAELPRQLPAGRLGTESEVASAVVFLLSPGARYVNGATLRVDGASSLYRHAFELDPDGASPRFSGFHRAAALPPALEGIAGEEDEPPDSASGSTTREDPG